MSWFDPLKLEQWQRLWPPADSGFLMPAPPSQALIVAPTRALVDPALREARVRITQAFGFSPLEASLEAVQQSLDAAKAQEAFFQRQMSNRLEDMASRLLLGTSRQDYLPEPEPPAQLSVEELRRAQRQMEDELARLRRQRQQQRRVSVPSLCKTCGASWRCLCAEGEGETTSEAERAGLFYQPADDTLRRRAQQVARLGPVTTTTLLPPWTCSRCQRAEDIRSDQPAICYLGGVVERVVLCLQCNGELPEEEREKLLAGCWYPAIFAFDHGKGDAA